MNSLKLNTRASQYTTIQYPKKGYLDQILRKNKMGLFADIEKGNWVLQNQNALVNFLKIFSLSISQSDEYLYNEIAYKINMNASNNKFTSIYNKGISHQLILFPESNHKTLIVVPFGKPEHPLHHYQQTPLSELNALTTLYTTDTRIRYNTYRMTEGGIDNKAKNDLTVVQLDVFALCFGFIRYCRERIKNERFLGLTANSYVVSYPLANFYMQHNQSVIINQMTSPGKIDATKWTKIDISSELNQYLSFQRNALLNMSFSSFNHYCAQLTQGDEIGGGLRKTIFPYDGNSRSYVQLSWVYCFGSMDWAIRYLDCLKRQRSMDTAFNAFITNFLKNDINIFLNQIPDKTWQERFSYLFNTLKTMVG